MADHTIICRCRDITREMILEAIARGCHSLEEIKLSTGAGIGTCHGDYCTQLIVEELSRIYAIPIEEILKPQFSAPLTPITLRTLAEAYEADREEDSDA